MNCCYFRRFAVAAMVVNATAAQKGEVPRRRLTSTLGEDYANYYEVIDGFEISWNRRVTAGLCYGLFNYTIKFFFVCLDIWSKVGLPVEF